MPIKMSVDAKIKQVLGPDWYWKELPTLGDWPNPVSYICRELPNGDTEYFAKVNFDQYYVKTEEDARTLIEIVGDVNVNINPYTRTVYTKAEKNKDFAYSCCYWLIPIGISVIILSLFYIC